MNMIECEHRSGVMPGPVFAQRDMQGMPCFIKKVPEKILRKSQRKQASAGL